LPSWWILAALGVIGVSIAAIRAARRFPYVPVGWFWYVGTLVPVIGFVQVGSQSTADRYTYIPLIGLFLVLAWGISDSLSKWPQTQPGLWICGSILITVCGVMTRNQIQYWTSSLPLWEHTLEVTTGNAIAHTNLGTILGSDRDSEAIAHLSEAIRLKPDLEEAQNSLGTRLARQGKLDEALVHFSEAIRIQPNFVEAYNNRGAALAGQGKFAEALVPYGQALRLNPAYPDAHHNLALSLMKLGKPDEAITHLREALRYKPNYVDAHTNLGVILANQGHTDEAMREFSEALRLDPNNALARRLVDQLSKRTKSSQ
jgi:Flp pilus assembly protein TadD